MDIIFFEMSNLISELPINKFYSPTPIEINTFNTLIPEEKHISYSASHKDYIIISALSSFIITIILYYILYYNDHSISSKTIILCYLIIFIIFYTSNLLTKQIVSVFS